MSKRNWHIYLPVSYIYPSLKSYIIERNIKDKLRIQFFKILVLMFIACDLEQARLSSYLNVKMVLDYFFIYF